MPHFKPQTSSFRLQRKPAVVIICGPTGVGKTSFAIRLAQRFGGRIIGADSMQIYRHMDVGTAKPTEQEKAAVPHFMVDIVDPDQAFDAAAFARQADGVIQDLIDSHFIPFVVGGTGLYIKALVYGLFESSALDRAVRERLKAELKNAGAAAMHARLADLDPPAADRIHPNDAYRIVRALEVIELTGRPISDQHEAHGFQQPRYRRLSLGLTLPREELYARIDQRVDRMIAAGLEQEVRTLLDRGYAPRVKSDAGAGIPSHGRLHPGPDGMGRGRAHAQARSSPLCQTAADLVPGRSAGPVAGSFAGGEGGRDDRRVSFPPGRIFDGAVKSPISALRFIALSLRRTMSTPQARPFAAP